MMMRLAKVDCGNKRHKKDANTYSSIVWRDKWISWEKILEPIASIDGKNNDTDRYNTQKKYSSIGFHVL